MEALGENLEILDNLDAKHKNVCTDRIFSKHAKMRHTPEDKALDGDEIVNGFLGGSSHGSPSGKISYTVITMNIIKVQLMKINPTI